MTPETAIPAELYFSPEEYDEGVRADGSVERIADIAAAAGRYTYLRRHINSPALRDIQPLVLVDMPGFDSPLDAHNKAIFSYLDKGCHYIVLTPAEDGIGGAGERAWRIFCGGFRHGARSGCLNQSRRCSGATVRRTRCG